MNSKLKIILYILYTAFTCCIFLPACYQKVESVGNVQHLDSSGTKKWWGSFAPSHLTNYMIEELPFKILWKDSLLLFESSKYGQMNGCIGDLVVLVDFEYEPELFAMNWRVKLTNSGEKIIEGISICPINIRFNLVAGKDPLPLLRHMSGSMHHDACYPSRAFRLSEEAMISNDSWRPVKISSGLNSAYDHVPVMQFALLGENGLMSGFFVGFEWSDKWYIEAGWSGGFNIKGNIELEQITLGPGEVLEIPVVHMGFFEGYDWTVLDNNLKKYVYSRLSGKFHGQVPLPTVTYDHWYGIRHRFDLELLKKQAIRAAELGCEYFCLDAGWYGKGIFGASGLGSWCEPDPAKFPEGEKSMKELSALVRELGMGFGLWHNIDIANGAPEDAARIHPEAMRWDKENYWTVNGRIAFDISEGKDLALNTLRKWIKTYDLTWMRWEFEPFGGFKSMQARYEVMDSLLREFPDLRIEGCDGGATNFDWGISVRTHSTWLSDHFADPEVCRYQVTGALRYWPAHFLNCCVHADLGAGDKPNFSHELLSRMIGAISFNGDIAGWSKESTAIAQQHVKVFKQMRHLMVQPVIFPLEQPKNVNDWDVVVYGDGTGEGQLMFVFRIKGNEQVSLSEVPGKGSWKQLLGTPDAQIKTKGKGLVLSLPERSSALWFR